jgi:prephenate dehydrogenase
MTIQLTIIGLGQIGASIGMALGEKKDLIYRVGHDIIPATSRQAEKIGAIDRVDTNLPNSVRKADLVLLCLPIDQVEETIRLISLDLREGAVVMDTSPLKQVVAGWAKDLLPAGRHYVGLTPMINPSYLREANSGLQAAHADLFQNGLLAITAPPGTESDAIKLAVDLTSLLGAMPMFADLAEIDGLMASTDTLPQILSAALLNATVDQPGWREGLKVAGRAYAQASGPIMQLGDEQSLLASIQHNRENVLRVLETLQGELEAIREEITSQDDPALEIRLKQAYQGGLKWQKERLTEDWANKQSFPGPAIEKGSFLGRLVGTRPKPKPSPKS